MKAEKRMKAGKADPSLNSDEGKRTDEVVAHKLGIGGKDTYRKEKFISDNRSILTPEDFADLKLSCCKFAIPQKDNKLHDNNYKIFINIINKINNINLLYIYVLLISIN